MNAQSIMLASTSFICVPSTANPVILLPLNLTIQLAPSTFAVGLPTGNSNPYVWSAWGWLEFKTGHISRARKLFDAATVVDSTHACAWHKWGTLERSQGNYLRARDLWMQVGYEFSGIFICMPVWRLCSQRTLARAHTWPVLLCCAWLLAAFRDSCMSCTADRVWDTSAFPHQRGKPCLRGRADRMRITFVC